MSRKPRIASETNFFHTMVQGIEKKFIFDNPVTMKKYVDLIVEKSQKYNVDILAYCIMHNHAHILIHVKDVKDMSKFFQCVNTSYALYFNKKINRVGPVFRDRYRSEGVFTVKQLLNVINYIHRNPLEAHICAKPEKYKYSSYNEYFGKSKIINRKILYHFFDKRYFKEYFKIST